MLIRKPSCKHARKLRRNRGWRQRRLRRCWYRARRRRTSDHAIYTTASSAVLDVHWPTSSGVHAEISRVVLQLNVGRHRRLGFGQPAAEILHFRLAFVDGVPLFGQRAGRRLGRHHGLAVLAECRVHPVGQVEQLGRRPFFTVRGRDQLAGQRPLVQRQLFVQALAGSRLVRQTVDQLALPLKALIARARGQHVTRLLFRWRRRRRRRRRRSVFYDTAVGTHR